MFFNKINMNTVRKNNMTRNANEHSCGDKNKKNNWLSNKMTNEYIYIYIKRRILRVYLFLTIKRFNLILSYQYRYFIDIIYNSTKYYLVSCLDVAFRLYQHLDDLRISPRCCPMNWRSSILNHFPVQNIVCVSSDISLDITLTRRLYFRNTRSYSLIII